MDIAVDACASYKPQLHLSALQEMLAAGCRLVSVSQLVPAETRVPLPLLAAGDCCIFYNCIRDHADTARRVVDEVPWGCFTMQGNDVPRRVSTQGALLNVKMRQGVRQVKCTSPNLPIDDEVLTRLLPTEEEGTYEPLYRHPVDDVLPAIRFTPECAQLRDIVHRVTGGGFECVNVCVCLLACDCSVSATLSFSLSLSLSLSFFLSLSFL